MLCEWLALIENVLLGQSSLWLCKSGQLTGNGMNSRQCSAEPNRTNHYKVSVVKLAERKQTRMFDNIDQIRFKFVRQSAMASARKTKSKERGTDSSSFM